MRDGWNSLMDTFEDGWRSVIGYFTGDDQSANQAEADKERAKRDQQNARDDIGSSAARQSDYDQQKADREAKHNAEMARIGQESMDVDAALQKANSDQAAGIRDDLAKKRADLAAMIARAHDEANKPDAKKPDAPKKPKNPLDDANDAKAKFESRGTFSGFNMGLAALNSSPLSKIEDAVSRTADNTDELVSQGENDDGGSNQF